MEERKGIFGLETEHAVLYVPEEGEGPARSSPPFEEIERVLFDCLLSGRKAAPSGGLKGGYFLENGGLLHMEAFNRIQADVPILEAATPECRSPWDLLTYSRAFDAILEDASRRSREALGRLGYRGAIAFGKNNLDSKGTSFGCHENFLVRSPPTPWTRISAALLGPLLFALFLPGLAGCVLAIVARALVTAYRQIRTQRDRGSKAHARPRPRRNPKIAGALRAIGNFVLTLLLFLPIRAYSAFLRAVAYPKLARGLTPFLVTRQILAGAGYLNFRAGRYELSQRAALVRSIAKIITRGQRKTIFDLKEFLYAPAALFRDAKRMTIALGDSNLSDVPNLLKIGTTALVIQMVEEGVSFDALRLRRPLQALREISAEGPWRQVRLRSGQKATAIEIQRAYLKRAKAHFEGKPEGRLQHGRILELWEETLERLADRPTALADTLDWAAKKSLLDAAVLGRTNWKTFFDWGRIFEAAGLKAAGSARDLPDLIRRTPLWRRLRLRALLRILPLEPEEFPLQRDLHFQARKIDLRFHELGGGTGYQRALEAEGLIRRLTDDIEVLRATREPPRDTRARIRGFYISRSVDPASLRVDWNEIEMESSIWISLSDPFAHNLPGEPKRD